MDRPLATRVPTRMFASDRRYVVDERFRRPVQSIASTIDALLMTTGSSTRLPAWLGRLVAYGLLAALLGCIAAAATAWYALYRVEIGSVPQTGGLHVREGWMWIVATDEAWGLSWVNAERGYRPSLHSDLNVAGVPGWAEPAVDQSVGQWRVGTLAVGWPARMVMRQWSEIERERLFVPHVEVDDDGFTIAKMARNFARPMDGARYVLLWQGVAVNVLAFGGFAFVVLLPRIMRGGFTRQAGAATPG